MRTHAAGIRAGYVGVMEPTEAAGRSRVARWARSTPARVAAPFLVVAALLAADLAGGPDLRIGSLMVAVPALCAVYLSPLQVLVAAAVTSGCLIAAAAENRQLDGENFMVVVATVVLVSFGAVAAATARRRRERQLARARRVAEVTQRVLLRPLPRRIGPLTLASMYLAAEEEAAIGGDLYAASVLDGETTRLVVGDVQGKGLGAVEVAAVLLTAFRRGARECVPLCDLPPYLDRSLREDLADLEQSAAAGRPAEAVGATRAEPPVRQAASGGPANGGPVNGGSRAGRRNGTAPAPRGVTRSLEGFVTAVLVDVVDHGRTLRVVNCGHPPPLLIRADGSVLALDGTMPGLPLGLGDLLGTGTLDIGSYDLGVGDVVLLYTDGVIESRNADGAFYPLAERLARWRGATPDELLRRIRADLERHAAGPLGDDVAMVTVQRTTT